MSGGAGEGVRDGPGCADHCDVDGVAGPVEVTAGIGDEEGNPDQDFEAENFCCKQARGEGREDAGEDGCGGEEEADGGDVCPEELRGREPFGDPGEQTGHGNDVADAEGDGAEAVEAGEERLAVCEGRACGRE